MGMYYIKFRDPKDIKLYNAIKMNKKTVEGRKHSYIYSKIQPEDILYLCDRFNGMLKCKVTYVNKYATVKEYLQTEGVDKAFGGLVSNIEQAIEIYNAYVPDDKIIELKEKTGYGFMGIGIQLITEYKIHKVSVKKEWFDFIVAGKKIIEGRLNKGLFKFMRKGDMVIWQESGTKNFVYTRIVQKNEKNSFAELIEDVGLQNILPSKTTLSDGVAVYRQYYTEEDEKQYGVVGIYIVTIRLI